MVPLGLALLGVCVGLTSAVALPQGPPPVAPTVDSLTMIGPGCPLGAGGLVQEVRNGTPVFLFTEWNLALSDADPAASPASVDKFCQEEIRLGNGPVGMMVRIATVSIGGWADLKAGSSLSIAVDTRLGGTTAGSSKAEVLPSDLENGVFEVPLNTSPEVWSPCVGADGKVPAIIIKTTVTLNGTSPTAGSVLGSSDPSDRSKALTLHFSPVWRPCA